MKPVIKDLLQTAKFPETVYHYTNANAFLGIIQNKELWASHIRFQNDKEEAIYSLDILEEVLDSKKDEFTKHGLDIVIGKNGFIPYIKVPFEEDCLRDITIAPCADEKYILDSTSYVCVYNGIDFLKSTGRYLKNSKVPYRQ